MRKEKDAVVEVEVSKAIDHFWRPAFVAIAAMIVGFGCYLAFDTYQKYEERNAQEELFTLQKQVEDKKEAIEKADQDIRTDKAENKNKGKNKDKDKDKNAEKTPETLQKNYGDLLKKYEVFIANHKGKKASYIAAIQATGLTLSYNDLNWSEKFLTQVAKTVKSNDVFFGLIKSQLGAVLMDLKKYQEAAEQYEVLTENKAQSYFHPQALLRLGLCRYELGDLAKAEAQFTKLLTLHPSTQAANEAKNMKKLVLLQKDNNKGAN